MMAIEWKHGGSEDFIWTYRPDGTVWCAVWRETMTTWIACEIGTHRHVRCNSEREAKEWCEAQITRLGGRLQARNNVIEAMAELLLTQYGAVSLPRHVDALAAKLRTALAEYRQLKGGN